MVKKIYNLVQNVMVAVAIFIVIFLLASRFLPKFNFGLYVIQSGSMEPTIKTGSIVIDKKQADYQEGDIITFIRSKKSIITHRIMGQSGEGSNIAYKTKGDNNDTEDVFLAKKNSVLGKVIFAVPYLGYLISFVKTKIGLIILIFIPALWFIAEEVMKLKKAIKERQEEKNKDNLLV